MAKFEKELEKFKEVLVKGDNFADIYTYFMDNLGERSDFLQYGKVKKNPQLKQLMEAVAEKLFRGKVEIMHLLLHKIPKPPFLHGPCFINGKMASVFYFEDIRVGMLIVAQIDGETKFIRFSGMEPTEDREEAGDTFVPAFRSKAIH
ncbi:MAG: hypothetical protein R2941_20130 [Desulfobacterales bacterium]